MKKSIILVVFFVLLVIFIWAARQQFIAGESNGVTAQERTCASLIRLDDFKRACPSSAQKQGLRIAVNTLYFDSLYKCSISVTARNGATFYVVADVFQNMEEAYSRMRERIGNDRGRLYDYIKEVGNLLGLGEISALDNSPSYSLLLLRDNVYTEISPSGGVFCPGSELFELGRLIYGRMEQL